MSRWLALALLLGACEAAGEPRLGAPVVAEEPVSEEPQPAARRVASPIMESRSFMARTLRVPVGGGTAAA